MTAKLNLINVKYTYTECTSGSECGKHVAYLELDINRENVDTWNNVLHTELLDSCSTGMYAGDLDEIYKLSIVASTVYKIWYPATNKFAVSFTFTSSNTHESTTVYIYNNKLTVAEWKTIINDTPGKILFCAAPVREEKMYTYQDIGNVNAYEYNFGFVTADKESACQYLSINKTAIEKSVTLPPKYNTNRRMANWYGGELTKKIKAASVQVIDEFIIAAEFSMSIPDFITVNDYHAKRHEQALEILNYVYNPKFILPLHMSLDGDNYMVLIPIIDKLTKGNFNASHIFKRNTIGIQKQHASGASK